MPVRRVLFLSVGTNLFDLLPFFLDGLQGSAHIVNLCVEQLLIGVRLGVITLTGVTTCFEIVNQTLQSLEPFYGNKVSGVKLPSVLLALLVRSLPTPSVPVMPLPIPLGVLGLGEGIGNPAA